MNYETAKKQLYEAVRLSAKFGIPIERETIYSMFPEYIFVEIDQLVTDMLVDGLLFIRPNGKYYAGEL